MYGFNAKVTGLLQTLREGEREKALAQLDPQIAEKIKERRQKERRDPGEGGIDAERSSAEKRARHSGVPDYELDSAVIESSGRLYKQDHPKDGSH